MSSGNVKSTATLPDLQYASGIVKLAKAEADMPLIIQPIPLSRIRFVSFSDSAWANRPDKSTQGGQLHLMADVSLLEGVQAWVSLIDWKSWTLKGNDQIVPRRRSPRVWGYPRLSRVA